MIVDQKTCSNGLNVAATMGFESEFKFFKKKFKTIQF